MMRRTLWILAIALGLSAAPAHAQLKGVRFEIAVAEGEVALRPRLIR